MSSEQGHLPTYITTTYVVDPVSGDRVDLEVWRLPGGKIVGISSAELQEDDRRLRQDRRMFKLKRPEESEDLGERSVGKFLRANIHHITFQDMSTLGDNGYVDAADTGNGWWLELPDELLGSTSSRNYAADMLAYGFSQDFLDLLQEAASLGCQSLRLDDLSPYVTGLNRHQW